MNANIYSLTDTLLLLLLLLQLPSCLEGKFRGFIRTAPHLTLRNGKIAKKYNHLIGNTHS